MVKPFDKHPSYDYACEHWFPARVLLAGPARMRSQLMAARLLPRGPEESDGAWAFRKSVAEASGMFPDAVKRIAAKPFQKRITVEGVPDYFDAIMRDADGQGRSFEQVLGTGFRRKVGVGVTHYLVDFPDTSKQQLTVPQRDKLRPYVVPVCPWHVTNWGWSVTEDTPELEFVCIREDRYEVVEGAQKLVERVRVVTREGFELWRKVKGQEEQVAEYAHPLGYVPFEVDSVGEDDDAENDIEPHPADPLLARPPLEDMAWIDLAYYRSSSEQNSALQLARAFTGIDTGVSADEEKRMKSSGGKIHMGRWRYTSEIGADRKFVEPACTGIEHGWRDLDQKRERMAELGSTPLQRRSGNVTATGQAIDEGKSESLAQLWVAATEQTAAKLLRICEHWKQGGRGVRDEMLPDLRVDIFSDFQLLGGTLEEARMIAEMTPGFALPRGLALREWKARGIIRSHEDLDEIEREMDEAEEKRAERDAQIVAEMSRGPRPMAAGQQGGDDPETEEQTA